ncbi:MAG TPA: tetratricopeptide repeat protein, partial [Polyangia bacterium]
MPAAPTLDFALRLVDGRGLLGLREPAPLAAAGPAPATLSRLELEIPELRFPFDVSGGAARFQNRRCRLEAAELHLGEPGLRAFIAERPLLKRFGLTGVEARILDGRIALTARAQVGDREAVVTAELVIAAEAGAAQRLALFVTDVRAYGFLPAPAPLVGLGLALGLGATPLDPKVARPGPAALALGGRPAIELHGIDRLSLHPLEVALWRALVPSGWRLPSFRQAPLAEVRVTRGEVILRYGGEPPTTTPAVPLTIDPRALRLASLHEELLEGDRCLAAGELDQALAAYAARERDDAPEIAERRLAVLASMPGRFEDALALGAQLSGAWPERRFAWLALGAVESERGAAARAAAHFERAAELAERDGDSDGALEASLGAGEEHARAGGSAATFFLERVLAARPEHERAATLLADRYQTEARWRDLLHLEKRRLRLFEGGPKEAKARGRIARLWLERLGDPERAREELERALTKSDADAEVWTLYARALEAVGEPERALAAIERAAAVTEDPAAAASARLRAAELAERSGAPEAALAHLQAALARAPSHPQALAELAALTARLGRLDDALAAYERALAAAPDDAARAALYRALAELARDLGDTHGARAYVERSLALDAAPSTLRLAAALAEAEGQKDDHAELLGRLAALGDREAALRRIELLLERSRFAEAADEAERTGRAHPEALGEALALLVLARAALGQTDRLRDALERRVQVSDDAEARVRLARLCADDGDLDGARRLLGEALESASDRSGALELLCDVLLRQGDDAALDGALRLYAAAREHDPTLTPEERTLAQARALAAQGAARARLGLTAEAAESFRSALALDPTDPHARAGLAEAACALKRWDEAREALEPLHLRGLPPRVERALRLGEIAERQNDGAAAIGFYQAALEAGASGADGSRAFGALIGLYRARGDYEAEARMLLRAADDERTGESEQVRAGRLVAAADVLRKRAGRATEAIELYERALALDPFQLAALDALEAIADADGDLARLAQVLGRKVAATAKRPAQQKAILGRLASLQAERLGRPDAAREAFERALAIDPGFRPALAFLAADARSAGRHDEEQELLERWVALPADPLEGDPGLEPWLRLARLHAASARPAEAERCLRAALALDPQHPATLALFAAQLEAGGRRDEAIAAYEELATLSPADPAPWTRLAALYRQGDRAGDGERLAAVLARLAERHAADGRRDQAEALLVEVAHLRHDRLQDGAGAQAALERALEVRPGSRLALGGLLALARARGDVATEDALLGRLVELELEPEAKALALVERARARQARGDTDGALILLADLSLEESPEAALRLRVELEESRGTLADATGALEVAWARARSAGDESSERWALRRLAKLAAARGPTTATEPLFTRAIALDPDDREAAGALAQLARARGDDTAFLGAVEQLLRIARRGLEGAAREAELCVESAEALRRLGRLDEAQVRLREALEAAPAHGATWRASGRLHRDRGAHREATHALERAAELGALDEEGYLALGDSHEQLGDFARAAFALARAGQAVPPARLASLLERAGQESEALALWRAQGGEESGKQVARLERRRAERAFSAGRAAEARVAALEVLARDPTDEEALGWALHGLSAAAVLAILDELAQRVPAEAAAALYRRAAGGLLDDDARLALERSASLWPDAATLVALADREEGVVAARRYQLALELDPGCAAAALGLARSGVPADAARALSAAYDQVANARTRARLSAALGEILRDRMGDEAGAREAYRRAIAEAAPEDRSLRDSSLRALATLERAAGDLRAAEDTLETLRQEGAAGDDDLRQLAELYAERGAHDAAIALYARLGDASELHLRSLEAAGRHAELVTLLEEEAPRRMPNDARALYLRAAAVCAGPLADPRRAAALYERAVPLGPADAELWTRLGQLYAGPLAEPDRAARCLARAFAADRGRTEVLLPLADFHHDLGEWEPSSDYYRHALAHNAVAPAELGRVHLRLAEHARRRADSLEEEEALLSAVSAGDGAQAWPRLAKLYRVRGDRARLAGALRHLAKAASGPEKLDLLREAVGLVDAEEAAQLDEQILAADPTDETTRERIFARLRAAGDLPVLIARLERELGRAADARKGSIALELGRLAARLGDDPRATEAYRAALKSAPSLEAARGLYELTCRAHRESETAPALEAALFDERLARGDRDELARLCSSAYLAPGPSQRRAIAFFERARASGFTLALEPSAWRALLRAELRFSELVAALDAAADDARDPEARLELETEAADVLDRQLGQPAEAARRYAGLLDRHPARRDFAERARQLWAAAGEPIHALAALDKELRLAPPEETAHLKIVRGELLLAAGADAEAEAAFLHALITTPRVGRAHAALADVYKRRGDLAGALEHLIAAADAPDLEPARAAACAVDAADVLLAEGDTTTAERLYQLAAALDPADRGAVEGLARLAAARGEHERHADLLGRAVLLTTDRREKARLLLLRARLFQLELGSDLDAYRCFKESVACDPQLAEAARGLRAMAEARGEWALAAEQLYREIAAAPQDDSDGRAALHLELARLLEEKLLDTDDSLRNYEQSAEILLATRGGRGAPWLDLVRLYTNGRRLADAAQALDRLADTLTLPGEATARAEALSRAGELYERAGQPQAAHSRLARAAAIGGEAGRQADETLLRLADQAGDPIELKRRIEERLAIEPEGPDRLKLLRRLLELGLHAGDPGEIDLRAQEVLARAPADPVAFIERKRVLEARGDETGLVHLLRARAQAVSDGGERAARRFEAGRLAERLGDTSGAAADYEAALVADPHHVAALDALADLAWRSRQLDRARALYAQLGDRPSSLSPDEVALRRAQLAEEGGYADEAHALYQAAAQQNPSSLAAHEALARLALGRGDEPAAYAELRAILDLLPLDAVDRITELRRQLGRLAVQLGERDAARSYFELVLAQEPTRVDVLEQLVVLYVDGERWEEAADGYRRLSYLAERPPERADLLFRAGELYRLGLDDRERANDAYLKAADLFPTHAPTLRRLISYYYREGELTALAEVARELESLPAALDEAAVEAGLGLALGGDEARGTVVVAVAAPAPDRLAEALAQAKVGELAQLDVALRVALRALGGGASGRSTLAEALRARIIDRPGDLGARLALGRLRDTGGEVERARAQYGVLTFIDPLGPAGTRLRELGAPPPIVVPEALRV